MKWREGGRIFGGGEVKRKEGVRGWWGKKRERKKKKEREKKWHVGGGGKKEKKKREGKYNGNKENGEGK